MRVRCGVFVPQGWRHDLDELADPVAQYEAMTNVARAADAAGYDSVWVFDHLHTLPHTVPATTFEAWTTTATLARDTRRVRVGQLVTCALYRQPALLAKIASTVDCASHGRLNVGLGAGWYADEARAYGYDFPEPRDRLRRLREAVEIVSRMWSDEAPVVAGRFYHVDQPINAPRGVQQPHPPLWIGGGGERVTLKLVARWADACNVGGDQDTIHHKLEVLRHHCEVLGRDYSRLIKSTCVAVRFVERASDAERVQVATVRSESAVVGTPAQIVEQLRAFVRAGIDYFILTFPRVAYDQTPLFRFASEVMPRL